MNRLSSLLFASTAVVALCGPVSAQSSNTTSFTVSAEPRGSKFIVDGIEYIDPVTFQWQIGSKHVLQWLPSETDGSQLDKTGRYKYVFGGWTENTGNVAAASYATQSV